MASDVIKSRADFQRVLQEALKQVGDRLRKAPKDETLQIIELQLDAMWRWTASDRTPTEDERKSINIGVYAVRELEPAETPDDWEFINNLHELNYYFENWPDDPDAPASAPQP